MASSRELLELAAEALAEGDDPFSPAFLVENSVTSGQCIDLAQNLAVGARIVARALAYPPGAPTVQMLAYVAEITRDSG